MNCAWFSLTVFEVPLLAQALTIGCFVWRHNRVLFIKWKRHEAVIKKHSN